ncbi:hypothetical protein [Gordonia sp. 852002-50395_SCH5434458]|uniref:hypothetical protein n=1 Tax=Gordonia sp. 852002-50395_SCH5434458 TaxID=1834090 RepID=UPI0007EA3263|nr:hypothetical protein [Gordonia sp. 852002-50395_SCH5434458]OBC02692.1 hypothetical protein A5785_02450 [Gordonia sp. 852002-50395_SCH5434458]
MPDRDLDPVAALRGTAACPGGEAAVGGTDSVESTVAGDCGLTTWGSGACRGEVSCCRPQIIGSAPQSQHAPHQSTRRLSTGTSRAAGDIVSNGSTPAVGQRPKAGDVTVDPRRASGE